jgi:tetratricopeptide (TPR) repeat protein
VRADLWVIAVVLLVSGCAAARPLSPSNASGWRAVTTTHFELYTDLDERTSLEAAEELETTRDALISAAWPEFHFPELVRTRVFVLANGLDFEREFGPSLHGLFEGGSRPAFYLYGPPDRWSTRWSLQQRAPSSVLRHEMTHQLAAVVYARAPNWFAEGIAQFLETVQTSEDRQTVRVGRTNVESVERYYADRGVTLERTLRWSESTAVLSDREVAGLYGTSWLLFHWLYNTHPEPFSRYQLDLARGVNPNQAWKSAFPAFDLDATEKILYQYVREGIVAIDTKPLHATPHAIALKPMTAADVHAARAQIAMAASHHRGEENPVRARSEVAQALELDPSNVEALLLDTWSPRAERLARVHAAAETHPDDARVFALLGHTSRDADERERAFRRALSLRPEDPDNLNGLAELLVERHRAAEALPLALRAVKRAPHDYDVLDTYAAALFQLDRCEGAVDYEQRAVDLAGESDLRTRRALVDTLSKYRAACAGAPREGVSAASAATTDADAGMDRKTPEETKTAPRKHAGLYTGLTVGYGYGAVSHTLSAIPLVSAGGNEDLSGGGGDLGVALGYGLTDGLALAIEGGLFVYGDLTSSHSTLNDGVDLAFARVGALADVYPMANAGFHFAGGVDYVQVASSGWGEPNNYAGPETDHPTGYLVHAAAGYSWRIYGYDLGPALRAHYGSFHTEHSDVSVVGVAAVVGATWF